jgi:leucyl-tRNA synthetase
VWHQILHDLGHVISPEPFRKLYHQGLILSFAYQREDRTLAPIDQVEERGDGVFIETATGKPVTQITAKMSKSLRNVVNPDDVIAAHGADTFRLYEMYLGPLDASKPWNPRDIAGLMRFLQRAWRLIVDESSGALTLTAADDLGVEKALHRTIAKVQLDFERLAFNTAIAALIGFVNTATSAGGVSKSQAERFARLLAPLAPHIAEELWSRLGHSEMLAYAPWPSYEEALLRDDEVEVPVQIMGKVRHRLMVPADADGPTMEKLALADPKVQELLQGKTVRKVVTVPGKLVNIVAN